MSKVVKEWDSRGIGHVVETDDGNAYLVDSCLTFDRGLETMVFEYDLEEDCVSSWTDLYAEWHTTPHDMMVRHKEVCESLETYLEDANPEHSYSMKVLYDM